MAGSQEAFLSAESIFEVLYEGTRGGGKTDCLLMSFCNHVGKGFGSSWKGILFRQTYKQLSDIITKTKKWFPQIWPEAKFNHSEHTWTWPSGEQLLLRQFSKMDDYWNYHGHEYPWIGWEELCNWPFDDGYKRMMSCCRSSTKGMPRMVRATTNPYGPGHNWVKFRFCPHSHNMIVRRDCVDEDGNVEPPRLSIHSHIDENKALLEADPTYKQKIAASAQSQAERKAWLEGSWDIVAGGMFDDVWNPTHNVIPVFHVPANWKIMRSFDWGSSRPFSVGWWAISNGEDLQMPNGNWRSTVKGDLFRVKEWYGWNGQPNKGQRILASDIAAGIIEREIEWGLRRRHEDWCRVKSGIADSQIFVAENGNCIATDMKVKQRLDDGHKYPGVTWYEADKRPYSRVTGWSQMRQMIANATPQHIANDNGEVIQTLPREYPGLFVTTDCGQFLRTVPVLPRDDKNMDDVDTDAEDHVGDETRYIVRAVGKTGAVGRTSGAL